MAKSVISQSLGMSVEIKDNSPEVLAALKNAVERGLGAIGDSAVEHAMKIITDAPAVVTGRLRDSITRVVEPDAVIIGTNVKYAYGIESGTHRRKGAVHFLERSARDYTDEYRNLMKDSLENA